MAKRTRAQAPLPEDGEKNGKSAIRRRSKSSRDHGVGARGNAAAAIFPRCDICSIYFLHITHHTREIPRRALRDVPVAAARIALRGEKPRDHRGRGYVTQPPGGTDRALAVVRAPDAPEFDGRAAACARVCPPALRRARAQRIAATRSASRRRRRYSSRLRPSGIRAIAITSATMACSRDLYWANAALPRCCAAHCASRRSPSRS